MAGVQIPQTVFLRHGGGVVEHDWPLGENLAEQLTKGMITQVSAPGDATWYKPEVVEPSVPELAGREIFGSKPMAPHKTAPKPDWVGYAVKVGGLSVDDADGMTKADLVERFGG